ncbi:MAG TPA: hypothetical protein VGI60_08940 [Chthoniobacterales bacterium]
MKTVLSSAFQLLTIQKPAYCQGPLLALGLGLFGTLIALSNANALNHRPLVSWIPNETVTV